MALLCTSATTFVYIPVSSSCGSDSRRHYCSVAQHGATCCTALQCVALPLPVRSGSVLQCVAVWFSVLQCLPLPLKPPLPILKHTETHPATPCNTLQHPATPCNTLQHPAAYCNTLQHTETHCNTVRDSPRCLATCVRGMLRTCTRLVAHTLQHTATHCNPLQHTTTHCNAVRGMSHTCTRPVAYK